MPRIKRPSPFDLTDSWPSVPSSDHAAEQARLFALNVQTALHGQSQRAVARAAGLNEGTLRHVLSGSAWPDLRTIAELERALGCELYPRTGP
ncbi:helix-turn-helix domain-containing protein [Microbacterium sp.]|uniref:helix-turn-helix domain-containing protein n=1 Tax=Microbacterium sp. TaxID=51671 RepID=UPI003F9DA04D